MRYPAAGSRLSWAQDALGAGWYLTWRLLLWVLCGEFCAFAIVRALALSQLLRGRALYLAVHSIVELGFVIGVIPWLWRLNHLVDSWTRMRCGRSLRTSVRWGVVWRGGLISLASFAVGGALVALTDAALGRVPKMMAALELVIVAAVAMVSMIGLGWGMLLTIAKQIIPPSPRQRVGHQQ